MVQKALSTSIHNEDCNVIDVPFAGVFCLRHAQTITMKPKRDEASFATVATEA
jgi:hypothetical protein